MKDSDSEDVQRLIRLKRYETPGDQFYEQFAENFKDRQRAELLQSSARSLLAERIGVWWDESNGSRWMIPAGAAAALGAGVLFVSGVTSENVPATQVVAEESSADFGLPDFPETTDEVIELQLPKPSESIPGQKAPEYSKVLRAKVGGSLREL